MWRILCGILSVPQNIVMSMFCSNDKYDTKEQQAKAILKGARARDM